MIRVDVKIMHQSPVNNKANAFVLLLCGRSRRVLRNNACYFISKVEQIMSLILFLCEVSR